MYSVYDLAFAYTNKFYNVEPDNNEKSEIIHSFKVGIGSGVTTEEISSILRNKTTCSLDELKNIFSTYNFNNNNLIEFNKMYYHNLLRCCPGPPVMAWDINSGEIKRTNTEPYFLEMRASITEHQVTDYYLKKFNIDKATINYNRHTGSIIHLVKKYGLDLTLFMIDIASDMYITEQLKVPTTPMEIAEYEHEAKEALGKKLNENKITGDDKIVYKRRIFNCRNGCQN